MSVPDPTFSHSAVHYCTELEKAGWSELGRGAGSRVFHRDTDREVIKVTDGDDCYLTFAKYASAHPQQWLPNLEIKHIGTKWAVIHIEKLDELDPHNANSLIKWWSDYNVASKAGNTLPSPKIWSDFASEMFRLGRSCACYVDIQTKNAMQRGSTLVFIDPLSH